MRDQPTPSPPRVRRTQAERSAATRHALLEATVEALVELGYAGVTTKEISERAGVTKGAQAHHFASKAELVTEAVRHLTQKLLAGYPLPDSPRGTEREMVEELLDRLWAFHCDPVFAAAADLWLASRKDTELREALVALEEELRAATVTSVSLALPRLAKASELFGTFTTALAALRGLALLGAVQEDVSREWQVVRRDLLSLFDLRSAD